MERRIFLRNTGIAAGAALAAPSLISAASEKTARLVILHTNDTHSNIDPFPANHNKYPGQGGVSPRAAHIDRVRSQEEHVLLLDAGDIFQGTPYFNKFGGVLEMKAMSEMRYDVSTMGNHDFDKGPEGFLSARKHASFPVVVANYDLSETCLAQEVRPHVVLRRGPLKIGVFGLGINLEGLVAKSNTAGVKYLDPIAAAKKQVAELKKEGCDVIICLSHLGFEYQSDQVSDRVLAASTEGIDLIIGGHTHTFLEQPALLKNAAGKDVIVNQVGYAGLYLGRIDLHFSKGKLSKTDASKIAMH
jgi:5'-nucleotidase